MSDVQMVIILYLGSAEDILQAKVILGYSCDVKRSDLLTYFLAYLIFGVIFKASENLKWRVSDSVDLFSTLEKFIPYGYLHPLFVNEGTVQSFL